MVRVAILQFASALLALFLGFGLGLSAAEQAGWMLLVTAILAFEHREVARPGAGAGDRGGQPNVLVGRPSNRSRGWGRWPTCWGSDRQASGLSPWSA
ncbi:hypothetical protein [Streptomyces sp. NPDC003717]|uniref:hypothetical protein n=1 Tax=Streptomyces sp. NPDC003717 TaxID=3154276 RepID=UPI0033AD9271